MTPEDWSTVWRGISYTCLVAVLAWFICELLRCIRRK